MIGLFGSLAAALVGCTPAPDEGPTPESWIAAIALDPKVFEGAVKGERDAWVALHAHDAAGAYALAADPDLDARAAWSMAAVHTDLAFVSAAAWAELASRWTGRASAPSADHPFWALVRSAAACAPTDGRPPEIDGSTGHPLEPRRAAHERAWAGDLDGLAALAGTPLAPGVDGRTFYDPCVDASLAAGWLRRASDALGGPLPASAATRWGADDAPWSGRLFAPWASPSALTHDLAKAPWNEVGAIEVDVAGLSAPEAAARAADQWDDTLAALSQAVDQAPDDGRALVRELDLVARARSDGLVGAARAALARGDAALGWELARRAASSGAAPSPQALAVLARAAFVCGRGREALEALTDLRRSSAVVSVVALSETVGDAVVMATLDRAGDSKED
jgi:hypothetical protein